MSGPDGTYPWHDLATLRRPCRPVHTMKTPAMKTPALATIYLDLARIDLMGDPRPHLFKVVIAAGKDPEALQVVRKQAPDDDHGLPVQAEEILDRTADPAQPIYLMSKPLGRPDLRRNPRPSQVPPQEPEWNLQQRSTRPLR